MNSQRAPISQVQVEEDMMAILEEMEVETEAFEKLSLDHARKSAKYKGNWAKIYLSSEGSIKHRESFADYQLADENYDVQIAEALMRSKREKLTSLRTALDALRTINANVRAQVQ